MVAGARASCDRGRAGIVLSGRPDRPGLKVPAERVDELPMSVATLAARPTERARAKTAFADPTGHLVVFAVAALVLGVGFNDRAPVFVADVFLGVAAVRTLPSLKRPFRRPGPIGMCALALAATWSVALVVHPSPVGIVTTLRYLCLFVTIPAFGRMLRSQPRFVGGVLAIAAAFESCVVVLQGLLGRRLGLGLLEAPDPFRSYGGRALAPIGTIHHADLQGWFLTSIAALLILLALRRAIPAKWAAGILALGVAAGVVSYRRVTILEWAGLGAALLVVFVARPESRRVATGLGAAMLFGAIIMTPHSLPGWTDRAEIIQQADTPFDSGRAALLPQATALLRSSPWSGVGPVQYLPALMKHNPGMTSGATILHVVPFLLTVEGGLPVGVALCGVAAACALAIRRRRPGVPGFAVTLGLSTPLVVMSFLTPLPTMYAIGPLLTALNLAVAGTALHGVEPVSD